MADEFELSVGQAHEFEMAWRRNGGTKAELKELCKGTVLVEHLKVVRGQAQIVATKHVVICTCGSFLNRFGSGWSEEEHKNCGTMELEKRSDGHLYINGKKVERYLSPNQQGGKVIQGHKLRKELSEPVLCACVLDYLLQHTELIPEDWKNGYTFFWGTIFRYSDGFLYVAYLCWDGKQWRWLCRWLGDDFYSHDSAARLASE